MPYKIDIYGYDYSPCGKKGFKIQYTFVTDDGALVGCEDDTATFHVDSLANIRPTPAEMEEK